MRQEVTVGDKRIILIGTAHISQASIDEVEEVIREVRPDTVCVELCASRYESIKNKDHWKNMDIVKVIKEGKAPLLMGNLIMSAFQKKMGDQLGVKPGAEMVAAIKVTEEIGAKTVLADREVTTTLKRAWGGLGLWEKVKLMGQIMGSLFETPDISEEEIEKLKEGDVLTEAIETMAKEMPGIKKVLIDERDRYLSTKISEAEGETIVAVVGAGHMPGIIKYLDQPVDLYELDQLPKQGKMGTILKWGIPSIIMGIIAYGFFQIDASVSMEMVKRWILINGVLSALGALIAGGHILTIIVAFIAAPITSLNPTIAAGWVSGLTEAWIRKPKVSDFESLAEDITTVKGFRRNEITKILLVVVLSNVGSALGTFIGFPLIASLLG
ncbi:MAG: conjugal transfer protein TraB [SAR324 cluster bacterium]|uniref:Conjugal transfer protein TraB n=1 Tax=SAR324 cluster bacterium TaxID=2024889 RepID=A0A2A4T3Z1_9DELT|nr:MAG: conjugal transfer protein TraB [SAR324 cluster bacterium]